MIDASLLIYQDMIRVTLYNYNGNRNTVNKKLVGGLECVGAIRDDTNVLYPVLTIRVHDVVNVNYCYIPTLGRYYFIDSINYLSSDKATLKLSVDVLKSYENEILSATGTVTISDNPDKFSSNRQSVYNRKPNFEKIDFPNKNLFDKTGSIIMVTIKGE